MKLSELIYYNAEMLESMFKSHAFWGRFNWYYKSNWRILHIDGMEGFVFSPKMPSASGKLLKFFQYKEAA